MLSLSVALGLTSLFINLYALACIHQIRAIIRDGGRVCEHHADTARERLAALQVRVDVVEKAVKSTPRHRWN